MIPKSGNRFSEKIMLNQKHDPERQKPISGQVTLNRKKLELTAVRPDAITL